MLDVKRVSITAALLLLATGSWWLTRTVNTPEKPFDTTARHDPDYTIQNFNATVMNPEGQRRYALSGPLLVHYSDDGSSDLTKPYLIQYRDGRAPIHIRADKGWMPRDRHEILMSGNVESAQGRDPRGAGGDIRTDNMKILLDR
ncbi:MAG: LPS export ABC transporter periplasmic protein LptC [Sulfuricaulis sp.]